MRILIVDDEPPARRRVRTMLEMLPDADSLEIVGEAEDGEGALEAIVRDRPDLVVLDVQMPGMDGLAVTQALCHDETVRTALDGRVPAVVFATAFDEHAVRAFDVHAVDYLVKPFDAKRLAAAIERVRERLRATRDVATDPLAAIPSGLTALLAAVQQTAPRYLARIAVRVGDRVYYVRTADIEWVEADGNYLKLHTGGGTPQARAHLIRKSLTVLAEELDPKQFARIHRSTLVNIDCIRELKALSDGEYQVILTDGTKLKLSRTFRDNLPEF